MVARLSSFRCAAQFAAYPQLICLRANVARSVVFGSTPMMRDVPSNLAFLRTARQTGEGQQFHA